MYLIPVNSLFGYYAIADGYMFDIETGQLLSNKNGSYVPLNGSVKEGVRRYNLQYKPEHQIHSLSKTRSVKHEALKQSAIQESKRLSSAKTINNLVEYAKTSTQKKTKGWIIGSMVDGVIQLSSSPKIHDTEASTNAEIERLAAMHKGATFVKMKIENFVVSGGVQWS